MLIPEFLLQHEVTVEAADGGGPYGPKYAAPAVVRCFLEEQTHKVRDPGGEEVTSSSTFYALPDEVCPAGSRVTLPSGRVTTAIVSYRHDAGTLPAPAHLEVHLQ